MLSCSGSLIGHQIPHSRPCSMWLQQQHNSHRPLGKHSSVAFQHHETRLITWPYNRKCIARRVHTRVFDGLKNFVSKYSGSNSSKGNSSRNADTEDEDGAEMVRIDTESSGGLGGTSEEVFGPLAVLLVGFLPPEYEGFRAMLNDIEADMVKVVPCTKSLLGATLEAALAAEYPQYEQPPLGQRRALFMSGMYGSEVVELIAAYKDAGLPPCAFAAAVPKNYQRTVQDLTDSVWKDHAAMIAKQQQQAMGDSRDS